MNLKTLENFISNWSVMGYQLDFEDYVKSYTKSKKINTQWDSLDSKLNGGILPGLYCLGAISSLGKTSFSLQLAANLAKKGYYVLYFTIEMPKYEMIARTISQIYFENEFRVFKSQGKNANLEIGTLEVLQSFNKNEELFKAYCNEYFNKYQKLCFIDSSKTFDLNVNQIKKTIETFQNETGYKPIVFIDYLQILGHGEKDEKGNDKYLNDKQSIDLVTKKLKQISIKFNIPIWVVSSFNRQSYKSHVSHECFKESGVIEYTSDVLMGLQLSILDNEMPKDKDKVNIMINNAKKKYPREITLVILKQRNGEGYIKQRFKFYPKNNFFRECADNE
ncbi:MAG: DnaB-like helicase C-terminal domain-containing protein [Candidatus Odinarchaeota archaeon]